MFRITLRKHPLGSCLALCSFHQSKINAIENVSFLFVYAKTMGTLTSHCLSDTAYKIRGNNNVLALLRKSKVSRFLWQTFPLCFSKLRIMEVPFPSLSTSLSLIRKADHTWKERQNLKVDGKTHPADPKGNCVLYLLLPSSTCFTFFLQVDSLHSSANCLSSVFSVCTANL